MPNVLTYHGASADKIVNHRIIEYPELEKTHKDQSPLPAPHSTTQNQTQCLRVLSKCSMNSGSLGLCPLAWAAVPCQPALWWRARSCCRLEASPQPPLLWIEQTQGLHLLSGVHGFLFYGLSIAMFKRFPTKICQISTTLCYLNVSWKFY